MNFKKMPNIIFIILPLMGCSKGIIEGSFKTDQEMLDLLADNINTFLVITDNKEDCNKYFEPNTEPKRSETCEENLRSLDVLDSYYSYYVLPNYYSSLMKEEEAENVELSIFEHRWGNSFAVRGYKKGFLYSYDNVLTKYLWEGNLNERAKKGSCDNKVRIVKVNDSRISGNWYLYESQYCEGGS